MTSTSHTHSTLRCLENAKPRNERLHTRKLYSQQTSNSTNQKDKMKTQPGTYITKAGTNIREPFAAQTEQRDTHGLFDETSTEKSVNWSKAFCPVCQPIVDGHFRKREREMQSEIARLQTQLDKATGNMPQTSAQRDTTAQPQQCYPDLRKRYEHLKLAHTQLHSEYSNKEKQLEESKAHAEQLAEVLAHYHEMMPTPESTEALAQWERSRKQ